MTPPVIKLPLFGDAFMINPPRGVTVFGFTIYFYGLIITIGFILAALYVYRRCESFGMTRDDVINIFICAIAGGLIGARLYYVAFNPSEYFGAGKWMNILSFRDGGLAVYGGIILGAAAAAVYSLIKKLKPSRVFDAGALGLLIGQSIGRWGNFLNREAYGTETALPWRMGLETFPGSGEFRYVHPTFLYESLWNALGFLLLHLFSRKFKHRRDGEIFLLYLLWYGVGRAMIEGLRTDSLYIPGTALRVSQILSAALALISCAALAANRARHKTPTPPETETPGVDIGKNNQKTEVHDNGNI
ncbi:MAG: prolipoprotein diacylglyceryl transferase [Oscillospiraceae bacterium]|jgi:phosphatidylglycerol:prolipoprotein diacylglycerol transferase|nr:prolipoprotein diacylglyceryl transferase [Oscillospiraceae bacterium]